MASLKEKLLGKIKQVVAEVTGDGKLHQEGKEQEEKAKQQPSDVKPFHDLDQLT